MFPVPTSCRFPRLLALLLVSWSLGAGLPAFAQAFNMEQDRVQMAELNGLWRFHVGDDPRWADPAFDDSNWPLLSSDKDWSAQGYKNYSGMAWYRFTVVLPEHHHPLALYVPNIMTSYQVFANGRLIGGFGDMPPHPGIFTAYPQTYLLPGDLGAPGKPVTIAIRVWHLSYVAMYYGGGPSTPPFIGDAGFIASWNALQDKQRYWSISDRNLLLLIYLLSGLAGLALFVLRRTEREYLWFGANQLTSAAYHAVAAYIAFHSITYEVHGSLSSLFLVAAAVFFLLFIRSLLKQERDWVFWTAFAFPLLYLAVAVAGTQQWISAAAWNAAAGITFLPFFACILLMLYRGARRRRPDASLLLVPVGLNYAAIVIGIALAVIFTMGHAWIGPYYAWFNQVTEWPFPIGVTQLTDLIMQLAILGILVLRFARSRRDEERLNTELESAREVQSILVPEEIPPIPGFTIRSVYKPAGQVGGDFFQIIPLAAGSVLIAIGDVSGKGIPAAMTVSLLVGTLRNQVESTTSPAEILAVLNRSLHGRSRGGFTTCLVLRADPDGTLTLANAGHLPPYKNGKEMALEASLPLGLDGHAVYAESSIQLGLREQLTLVTDGVIEARSKAGELFGFDRAQSISTGSADSIAQAAQEFGQEDDITVVTIARVEQQAQPASPSAPALSPTPA